MVASRTTASWRAEYPWIGYVAPFFAVLLLLALPRLPAAFLYWEWPFQVALVGLICFVAWPSEILFAPARTGASIALGALVFVLWISPDLISPAYRHSFPFSNALVGHVGSSMRPEGLRSPWVLFWRTVRASTVVPIAEELFWRGWLMRWLIKTDFQTVPIGAYSAYAFWITAVLFAVEHGPYWDVGLITGIVYNYWMIRTKSIADCILMHAVTNLLLSIYVIAYGQWQYWQ